jgi:hypothetical protein
MFHVSNLMSIFCHLGHLSKESLHVWGSYASFLQGGIVSTTPNSQAGGSPFVSCLWLLIQCIHSYPPSLEAISTICNLRTCHAVLARDPLTAYNTHW